jgi:hypothetical protein
MDNNVGGLEIGTYTDEEMARQRAIRDFLLSFEPEYQLKPNKSIDKFRFH